MSNADNIIVATAVTYFHENDETAFFEWLGRIDCVESFDGEASDLFLRLKRQPNRQDLQELLAFCFRYGIDLRQLAKFETPSNRAWLRDPDKYWYEQMFG